MRPHPPPWLRRLFTVLATCVSGLPQLKQGKM